MSKFHTTVSRRTFMKGLGLTGVGLGAAAAAAPVFHDLDEVASSPDAEWKRAWWIKERDFLDPTVPIDWSRVVRRDQSIRIDIPGVGDARNPYFFLWRERDNMGGISDQQRDNQIKDYIQGNTTDLHKGYPHWTGDSIETSALRGACSVLSHAGGMSQSWYDLYGRGGKTEYLGIQRAAVPDIPWSGTPEEAYRILQAASRFFGAVDVSCMELDETTKKLILAKDRTGYTYEFRDVNEASIDEATKTKVIPNKCKYLLTWTECQPTEATYRAPSGVAGAGASLSYTRGPRLSIMLQEFIRGLGYIPINGYSFMLCPTNPVGALSGQGEHGRMGNILISPENGAHLRGMWQILTDLPVTPTKPIEFGLYDFCRTCKICAEACPFDALSYDDPTDTFDPSWRPGVLEAQYGYKGYSMNNLRCVGCRSCQGACPFNSAKHSFIHDLVGWTAVNLKFMNEFNASMERSFHYGLKDPESWWEQTHEPTFGVSTKWTAH